MADPSGHGGYGHYHQQQQIPQQHQQQQQQHQQQQQQHQQQQQQYYYQMGHPAATSDSPHQQMQMAGYPDGHLSRVMAVQQQGHPSMRSNSPAQMPASYQDSSFQSASPMFGFSRDGTQIQQGLNMARTTSPDRGSASYDATPHAASPPQQVPIGLSYPESHVSRSYAAQQSNQPAQSSSPAMNMYAETQISRPLAAVQHMGPGRPLTPVMSINSPASAPVMRSASPLVPYANYPAQTDSPVVNINGSNMPQPRRHISNPNPVTSAPTVPHTATGTPFATSSAPAAVVASSTATSGATSSASRSHRPASSHRKSSTGKQSSQQQPVNLNMFLKTGIYLVRLLRAEMMKRVENPEMSATELAKNAKEVERMYLDLEKLAQQNINFPEAVVTKGVFNLAATQDNTMQLLDTAVDAVLIDECFEASAVNHYELLRMELSNIRPVTSQFKKTELTLHNVNETHEQFESAVRHMIRDRDTQKSHNYRISLHPCGLMCSLLEIELSKRKDSAFVSQVKATIFVQYGQLIIVRLGSPAEQLISEEEAVRDSRYDVYRKMSTFATARLSSSSTSARLTTPHHISAVIMFLQLFTLCFSTPCCKCKKLMKDLLPPTRIADVNVSKPLFQHENCE